MPGADNGDDKEFAWGHGRDTFADVEGHHSGAQGLPFVTFGAISELSKVLG